MFLKLSSKFYVRHANIYKYLRYVRSLKLYIHLKVVTLRKCNIVIFPNEKVRINKVKFVKRVGLMWFTMNFKPLDNAHFHKLAYNLAYSRAKKKFFRNVYE